MSAGHADFGRRIQSESLAAAAAAPVDWTRFFEAAGLDRARFQPAEPDWTPRVHADERVAWIGDAADLPGVPLRIEAASHLGAPVNFQIIAGWGQVLHCNIVTCSSRHKRTLWADVAMQDLTP